MVVVNDLQLKIKGSVYDSQIKGNLFVKFRMVSDLIGIAETGSGKTLAYLLPICHPLCMLMLSLF